MEAGCERGVIDRIGYGESADACLDLLIGISECV